MKYKLENYLIDKYGYTRSKSLYLIKNGYIFINNTKITRRSHICDLDDSIQIIISQLSCKILWMNENLAIVYKPYGMVSELCSTTSFVHSVLEKDLCEQLNINKVFLLHRLDKETSGIMAVALNEKSYIYYKDLMRSRCFLKSYKAFYINQNYALSDFSYFVCDHGKLVWLYGNNNCLCLEKNNYLLNSISIKETNNNIKISKDGKLCETLMSPIVGGYNCILVTGRTHQIRLTMKSINQVICGDFLYGSKQKSNMQLFSYYLHLDLKLVI